MSQAQIDELINKIKDEKLKSYLKSYRRYKNPLADEEPLTKQHVNVLTVTEPTFTLNVDVATTAKFIAEGLVIVKELPDAIFI